MKGFIILAFVCLSFRAGAVQSGFVFPAIAGEGLTLLNFVPDGWMLIDSATGDLNKDGKPDLACDLEYHDSVDEKTINEQHEDTWHHKPRMLLVLLRDSISEGYYLSAQNNTIILRADEGGILGDPYGSLEINEGILEIGFYGGSNWRWTVDYKFRYQSRKWVLIGADKSSFQIITGESSSESYNMLTHKAKITTEDNIIDESAKPKVKWLNIRSKQTLTLDNFKGDGTVEILKGKWL